MSNTSNNANYKIPNILGSPNTILQVGNGGASTSGYTFTNSNGYALGPNVNLNNDPASLEVKGKIIHNGVDLEERLRTIERVLMIPERDAELEKEFPKLKKAYDDYIKQLEKYRTWKRLNNGKE